MNRYLVFLFERYYPCGGWRDFDSSWENFPDANARALRVTGKNSKYCDYHGQVVDMHKFEIISSYCNGKIDDE